VGGKELFNEAKQIAHFLSEMKKMMGAIWPMGLLWHFPLGRFRKVFTFLTELILIF